MIYVAGRKAEPLNEDDTETHPSASDSHISAERTKESRGRKTAIVCQLDHLSVEMLLFSAHKSLILGMKMAVECFETWIPITAA